MSINTFFFFFVTRLSHFLLLLSIHSLIGEYRKILGFVGYLLILCKFVLLAIFLSTFTSFASNIWLGFMLPLLFLELMLYRAHICHYIYRHLHRVFTYICSLLIEKDICDRRNISNKFLCVCVCLFSGDLFIFRRVFPFFSHFLCSP